MNTAIERTLVSPTYFVEDKDLRSILNNYITNPQNTFFFLDKNAFDLNKKQLEPLLKYNHLIVEGGEALKDIRKLPLLYNALITASIDRKGLVIAIGGGAFGDTIGFIAATYLRGVQLIHIPTTLLSMVDSSIGGKNGINLSLGKNLIGTFHQPKAIAINPMFLGSLPSRTFNSGIGEIIKYGLLHPPLFQQIMEIAPLNPTHPDLIEIIKICCKLKEDIVALDPKEEQAPSPRMRLNLGHTFAHSIEQVSGYTTYTHGEAVGIGLISMLLLSESLGLLEDNTLTEKVEYLLAKHQLPYKLQTALPTKNLMDAITKDKKTFNKKTYFILIKNLGNVVLSNNVPLSLVQDSWHFIGSN